MLKQTSASILALIILCSCAAALVRAENKTDSSDSQIHDAAMARSDIFHLMNDMGCETPDPDGTVTWAEYLAMICRIFAADDYWYLNRDRGVTWGAAAWHTARAQSILKSPDIFSITAETMWKTPVCRQDAAVLLSRLLPEDSTDARTPFDADIVNNSISSDGAVEALVPLSSASAFPDFIWMDRDHQDAVSRLLDRGLIEIRSDGFWGPNNTMPRRDAVTSLLHTLDYLDQVHTGEAYSITAVIQDEHENILDIQENISAVIGQSLADLAGQLAPEGYKASCMCSGAVSTALSQYILYVKPLTDAETAQKQAESDLIQGLMTQEEYDSADFWLHIKDDNAAKRILLFQDENWGRKQVYESVEEASINMTDIQVPVWNLWNGNKTPGTMTLTIHQALAQDVVEIFTEIYEDPERFPIESAGGFRYQSGTTGEHNNGTAIDINADANYQVRDGIAETGTHWSPGKDPFSILTNGSVVRAFENHGWTWGGADWTGYDDASTGYHDYMHFSYRGR